MKHVKMAKMVDIYEKTLHHFRDYLANYFDVRID